MGSHHIHAATMPMTWIHIRMFLQPRVNKPEAWEHFMGICLFNVMSKLYMSGVMHLTRCWAEQHLDSSWTSSLLFGIETDCRCEDLLMCFQAVVQSGSEWPTQRPVIIASIDIRQAFDYVSPRTDAERLRFWGFPAALVRGIVRESIGVSAEAVCPGIPGHFHLHDDAQYQTGRHRITMVFQHGVPDNTGAGRTSLASGGSGDANPRPSLGLRVGRQSGLHCPFRVFGTACHR